MEERAADPDPVLLTMEQAQARLQLSRHHVERLIRDGHLRAIRLGPQTIRIPRSELEECPRRLLASQWE